MLLVKSRLEALGGKQIIHLVSLNYMDHVKINVFLKKDMQINAISSQSIIC